MRRAIVLFAGLSLATAGTESLLADGGPRPDLTREVPDDPYLPPPAHTIPPQVPELPSRVSQLSVQVNVDQFGANIIGDAGNETSIAVDPTAPNRMVIGWRQFDTILSNFRQAGWAWSHDGGRTWTFPGVIQGGTFRSDPVLGADADGTIYYCSLRGDFAVHFFKSFDGGLTWGPQLPAFGGDKQWFTIDRGDSIGRGNIYMSWNVAAGCCGDDIFTRSTDGGSSFDTPGQLFGTPIFGTLDVAANGDVFISGVVTTPYDPTLFLCLGSDNAKDPQLVPAFNMAGVADLGGAQILGAGPNPGGLLGQVNLAVDRSTGPGADNVYMLCSVDPPGADPMDVMIARSANGGQTWDPPVRVNDDPAGPDAWQWFGTMSVAPDGRIDAVWLDTRSSGAANISELYYAFSTDQGATWSTNAVMSPAFDSHVGWPNQNKMGDYFHMVSDLVGADLAWAATFNGEQDVYHLRIGPYDCNGNGEADVNDIANLLSGDCNVNGIPDECEIAAGTLTDADRNGFPDECSCDADLDGDGQVGVTDLLALLGAYGSPANGPPDLDGSGVVDVIDLLMLLAAWGPC